ncbi:MAG: hypothetical protein U0175_23330 [Caldilineaceae bacterium]
MFTQPFKQIFLLLFSLLSALLGSQGFAPQLAQAEATSQVVTHPSAKANTAEYAIAYVGPSRENQQIRLINPDGSHDRLLWQTPTNVARQDGIGELSWRSDSSELAFDSGHDWERSLLLRDIYSIAPDGTHLHRLTRPPAADDAERYPTGNVTFWLNSHASGDVQLYIEGADVPIKFSAQTGYSYQITTTVADLGANVRQYVRLYDPSSVHSNWCYYDEEAWVDVIAGATIDVGAIPFRAADDMTCPQTLRPSWIAQSNELFYLYAEASTLAFQADNNIWQMNGDAPVTTMGERVLDYHQYLLEGRLFLVKAGPAAAADQLLAVVRQKPGFSDIFLAPIADPGQRQFFNLGSCPLYCDVAGLAWLPDGSGFVFSRFEKWIGAGEIESKSVIYRYTFADQLMTPLYEIANQAIGRLDISPDGSQIIYEQSGLFDETTGNYWLEPLLSCPCQLWIMNSDGSDAHLFVEDGRAPAWSPTTVPEIPPLPDPTPATAAIYLPFVLR